MNQTILTKVFTLLCGAFLVTACGQKGALYLPDNNKASSKQESANFLLYNDKRADKKTQHSGSKQPSSKKAVPRTDDF